MTSNDVFSRSLRCLPKKVNQSKNLLFKIGQDILDILIVSHSPISCSFCGLLYVQEVVTLQKEYSNIFASEN